MKIYYLDEPLNHQELVLIIEALNEREGNQFTKVIEQIHIPTLLPVPDTNGKYHDDIRKLIDYAKRILIKRGIHKDYGHQVILVLTKEFFWDGIFQLAISEITGFHPYVVQRWYHIDDKLVRGDIRLIDGHGMMGYKD
jgi:hypothetical protein